MMRLAIIGASGHGKVVADCAELSGWKEVVFFDDDFGGIDRSFPWPLEGDTDRLVECLSSFDGVVVAIGSNSARREKQSLLQCVGAQLVNVVHPTASVSPYASVGLGSVVLANAVINAFSSVGQGTIVNTGSIIEHDCTVGDFAHLSPNAVLAGGAKLGLEVWVGACASIRHLISVGDSSVVGMGAVVTRDVGSNVTVVGNPARIHTR